MLEISDGLKNSLINTNQELQQKYSRQGDLNSINLRNEIKRRIGRIIKLERLSKDKLKSWLGEKVIVGVDGSVNKIGSNYPHYLYLLQALAKNTEKEDIIKNDLFCPLVSNSKEEILEFKDKQQDRGVRVSEQEAASRIRISKLATLELEVAIKAIKEWKPKLIMLDGSLIRYRIESEEKWEELKKLAIREEVLLLGVIEEIGTQEISKQLIEGSGREVQPDSLELNKLKDYYDRELLFGLLEAGEMLALEFKSGLKTAFMRTSRDPQVIGIDLLEEQDSNLRSMANLVYTLTPEAGRGIPIWLDIVDHEVRISDQMMESLVDAYLDSDLKRRLFYVKREGRVY